MQKLQLMLKLAQQAEIIGFEPFARVPSLQKSCINPGIDCKDNSL